MKTLSDLGSIANPARSYHLALALWFARQGIRVFPCGADKRPLIKDWENAASCDPEQVSRWWKRNSNALVGLPCRPNNIAVLDVDRHHKDADGIANLKSILAEQGKLPDQVIVVQTPNDGMHVYFNRPSGGLKSTAGKIAPGLDTRGDGGYVIAPGSTLPDGRRWVLKRPSDMEDFGRRIFLKELPGSPSWFVALVKSTLRNISAPEPHAPSRLSRDRARTGGSAVLERECQKVRDAREGTRNEALNKAAFTIGQLVGCAAISNNVAEFELAEAARDAGLDDSEITQTIRSGLTAGQRSPRLVTRAGNELFDTEWPELGRDGRPKPGYQNAVAAIQKLSLICQHDTFHGRKTIAGYTIGRHAGDITDDAIAALRALIVQTYGFDPGKEHLNDAVNALCIANQFDPISDWLTQLRWDGNSRLETWLIHYAGAADTPLNRAIGVLMLVAMVRRAKQPGCKFDLMIVLEGAQGCGKSSLLQALAGGHENFTDVPLLTLDAKGVAEVVGGRWVVEVPELAGLSRRAVEDTKALLSRTDDRARPAYGRFVESHPRRCIFVGTTNAEEYLLDDTGNRRFAPVRVTSIDLDGFRRDRDQLFAEAVHLEKSYGVLSLPAHLWIVASEQTEQRRIVDPWTETLGTVLDPGGTLAPGYSPPWENLPNGGRRITTTRVATLLNLQPKDTTAATDRRITSAMRSLGWSSSRWRPHGGSKVRGFISP